MDQVDNEFGTSGNTSNVDNSNLCEVDTLSDPQ